MLDILFKQLGFKPADIKQQIADAAETARKINEHYNNRLDLIEQQNNTIINLLNNSNKNFVSAQDEGNMSHLGVSIGL